MEPPKASAAAQTAPPTVPAFRSSHGPKYHYRPSVAGITAEKAMKFGLKSGAYGAVALFTVIFYASGIPRVKKDIMQKIPIIGNSFIEEIPASDNPY